MAIQNFVKVSQDHKHIIVKSGGLRGSEGPQGPQGPAGTVAIGTTTTLAPESAATVTNTGTAENAILNFGIPKGSKGDKGDQGIQGPKGDPGAGLVITGSVDTYAELPSGFGPDDAGKAYFVQSDGKLYVWSGTQWPADGDGAQFEGPKGDTGATGATGPAGYSPSASVVKVGDTTTITITDEHGTTTANVNDGTPITVDSALSTSSENPVQNKVITNKINTAAFVGSTVVGGTSLIDTSDIAPGAITTTKIADGAVTSSKIDSTTFYYESPTQTISSISSLESITVRLADIIPNYSTIVANNIIVGAFVVFTGGGTGAATYKMQGIGGSLDQQNYGFVLNNNLEQALGPWYYKVILTLLKKQSS